jgi:HSP20 family protein
MGIRQFEPLRAMRDLDRKAAQMFANARLPHWVPVDAWREGQSYHVELDLPGVHADSIELQVEPSTVVVTAQRRAPQALLAPSEGADGSSEAPDRQVLATERPHGPFSRRLVLGEGLDLEAVEARYADGVLHLTIPLAAASRPRRIKVDVGGQAGSGATAGAGQQAEQPGGQQPADGPATDLPGGGETRADGPAPEPTGEAGRSEGQTYDPSI